MKCPKCSGYDAMCIDSRDGETGRRRRYACPCGVKFTTVEMHVEITPGRPGLPRKGANAVTVLKSQLANEAEDRAKQRIRELLE